MSSSAFGSDNAKKAEALQQARAKIDALFDSKDDNKASKPAGIALLPACNDAVRSTVADLTAMRDRAEAQGRELETFSYRYIWVPDANPRDLALTSFALNSVVSRSDINFAPDKPRSPIQYVAGNTLVRVDLFALCPRKEDFLEVARVWDSIFNPYFLFEKVEQTKVTINRTVEERVRVSVAPYKAVDGRIYDYKYETRVKTIPQESFELKAQRVFGPHVDAEAAAALVTLTQCENPILWVDNFLDKALAQTYEGKYYEFIGLERNPEKGTAQEAWLRSLGVSEDLITKLRADQRAAMTKSGVTGKPRRIDVFDRPTRVGVNQGLVTITHDMEDEDYDPAADPFLNLLEFDDFGLEVIYERNNGHLAYVLFDSNGNLVDTAPDTLVKDHKIPDRSGTARLEPAISCIRCHSEPGNVGFKPFVNHVRQALDGFLNVYDDRAGKRNKFKLPETLETLSRLYAGDFTKSIRRAREDHSDALIVALGDVTTEDGLPWTFENVGAELAAKFNRYRYDPVTPQVACQELGYVTENEAQARLLLHRLLGRLEPAAGTPLQQEDIRLGLLKRNIPINRFQWELVYVDAALRARMNTPSETIEDKPNTK